jgi:hypothetical protein
MFDFYSNNVIPMMVGLILKFFKKKNEILFFFLVKDKSEKPFALAFLPLIEKAGTVIQDGHRHLVVYKVCILIINK